MRVNNVVAISSYDLNLAEFPTPGTLTSEIPLRAEEQNFIAQSRKSIEKILLGEDRRLLLIVGPCSIHDVEAAFDYATRLEKLSRKVSDSLFIVMRTYFEKARTGYDWKGLLYDPHIDGSGDMALGLKMTRKFLKSLATLRLPSASEILGPSIFPYFSDLLSWGCIGARTSSSQPHREIASSLPFPIGFKNSVDGNLTSAVLGIHSARAPHTFLMTDGEGKISPITSEGNRYSHLVLRGSERGPNHHKETLSHAINLLKQYRISSGVIVDCSHDNCRKDPLKQIEVFNSVLQSSREIPGIAGLMLESFIEEGSDPGQRTKKYGLSITDPCLSWEMTEELIEKTFFTLKA